jgi:DNA adenine methylase
VAQALLGREALSPPLKWAGGKRWLVPILREVWQSHQSFRLVEPFVGGMAVALGLQPKVALLNDLNPHLINFYCWLQKGLLVDIPLRNDSDYYYLCRQRFNELTRNNQINSLEAAKLFYFMNRTGYNGLCRFNSSNQFNVPFGRYKTIHYVQDFSHYISALKNFEFVATDFTQLPTGSNDFIYADPPYDVEFTKYSANDFKWQDQIRLVKWLDCHGGPIVASNQATDRIVELYSTFGFSIKFLDAPRRISCNGDRQPAREILAYRGLSAIFNSLS